MRFCAWLDHHKGGEYSGTAYSAAKVLLCMRRRSTSAGLLTTKALWPEGIMWRVFLFEPNPIYRCRHPSANALSLLARTHSFLLKEVSENQTYRWHHSLALEPSPHSVVDTLWFAPIRGDAHEAVTLMAVEALRACYSIHQLPMFFFTATLSSLVLRRNWRLLRTYASSRS